MAPESLVCSLFHKITESGGILRKLFFGNHVSTVLIAEEIIVVGIFAQPQDVLIGKGALLHIGTGQGADDDLFFLKEKLRAREIHSGFFDAGSQLVRPVVGRAVCAGGQIAAIADDQNAPPLGTVYQSEHNGSYGNESSRYPVFFAEEVILHTG